MKQPRFIQRNWQRSEHDDFELNVRSRLSDKTEAQPVTANCESAEVVGWVIIPKYS